MEPTQPGTQPPIPIDPANTEPRETATNTSKHRVQSALASGPHTTRGSNPRETKSLSSRTISTVPDEIESRDVDKALTLTPSFQYKPISAGTVGFGTFNKQCADDFMDEVTTLSQLRPARGINQKLESTFKTACLQFANPEAVENLIGQNFTTVETFFDTNHYGAQMPIKHSQVHLLNKNGDEEAICANHIIYDDLNYGVAMPAKTATNIEDMLKLAFQENCFIFVDLHSPGGYGTEAEKENTKAEWAKVSNDSPTQLGEFTLQNCRNAHDSTSHELNDSDVSTSRYDLEGLEGNRILWRIHYTGWPDSGVITLKQLEKIHKLIDKAQKEVGESKIAVNCHAGVGRTGTLFATRHMREKAKLNQLDPKALNSEVFSALVQGKLSRNASFIQTLKQVCMVKEAAEDYAKTYT